MTTEKTPRTAEIVLVILNFLAILGLVAVIVLCAPYMGKEAVLQAEPTTTTAEVTEAPTEETFPPPDPNPYGRNDFQYENGYLTCLAGRSIPGIDVSAYQGDVDWQQVADSGIEFVMVRLGYRGYGQAGKLMPDDFARDNIRDAQAAGLMVGAYFFSQALSEEEAREEAAFALEILGELELQLPLVFDWEYISDTARTANMDARTLTDCTIAFCEAVEEAGHRPMIYFNWNQGDDLLYLHELEEYPFWLAFWQDRMTYPHAVEMWQYTATGKVPGIEGDVDIDIYFE